MRRVLAAALALVWLVPTTASAGKKKKEKDKDRGEAVEITVSFSPGQRDEVRRYFVGKHGRGKCPPGLAKKQNKGCLPPGLAKKRYDRGQPLPHDVEVRPLPPELVVVLGDAPEGCRYGVVDGDVVKLIVGTLLVVDAIEGLVE